MVLKKHELEASLHEENKLIQTGKLKEENPLDLSEPFERLCNAVRRGDLKVCQEAINDGANINGRDRFDYTPLILGSLCGRYEIVQFLLESGALCERDTFQGERCLYNALNDRIRSLLLEYDYSKSSDPLQPLAGHITSLLARDHPSTTDIVVTTSDRSLNLHKFVLAARSPYFRKKLDHAPETTHWKLPITFPPQSFEIAMRYIYLGELPTDVSGSAFTGHSEIDILEGIEKISRHLEIESLWEAVLEVNNRRVARQQRTDETVRGRDQLDEWFKVNVLGNKIVVDSDQADDVKWDRNNSIFADILLRADEQPQGNLAPTSASASGTQTPAESSIPVGPLGASLKAPAPSTSRSATLYPVHRAMLLRSEYFLTMFSSSFLEAQDTPHLQIVTVDCTPAVLEAVLAFLYAERADFGLELALELLFAADQLLIERLKTKAAQVISALGSGTQPTIKAAAGAETDGPGASTTHQELVLDDETDPLDPFAVLHAAWDLRVPRLEEFAARYLAYRLEGYIDLPEFVDAVSKSAARIRNRQETDTIELVDDIRYFLSERFRLRFEGEGLEEMLNADAAVPTEAAGAAGGDGLDVTGMQVDPQAAAAATAAAAASHTGVGVSDAHPLDADIRDALAVGEFRTLDGELAGDEFTSDAINYQLLLGKIDTLLERLNLED